MRIPIQSRRGFELSVSTLVVMILGIAILAGGALIVKNLVDKGSTATEVLTNEQNAQLQKMLTDGQLVAVYPSSARVDAGKTGTFGLAVHNVLDADKKFTVSAVVKDSQGATPTDVQARYFPDIAVGQGETQTAVIGIATGKNAKSGVYTVTVTVKDGADIYDSVRFFTVNVR